MGTLSKKQLREQHQLYIEWLCLFCKCGHANSAHPFFERFTGFCERKSYLLFCHERPEPIAHGRSFVMSNLRESLLVFCKEQQERIAQVTLWKKSEWAKSDRSDSLFLGITRWKPVTNIWKITNFSSESLVFCK